MIFDNVSHTFIFNLFKSYSMENEDWACFDFGIAPFEFW